MRKLVLCLALALICTASLFAVLANVTWTWYENDPDVMFYRYQVDSQDDGGWTVVDSSVNEVTLLLDVSQVHSLYLQQSYDGELWSPSSVVESEIFTDFGKNNDEEPAIEETVTEETVAEEVVSQEAISEEEPVQTETAQSPAAEASEKAESRSPFRSLDYGIGYLNTIPDSAGPKTAGAFVALSMPFIDTTVIKVGFKANLAVFASKELFTHLSDVTIVSYANILALGVLPIGNGELYLALGPDAGFDLFNGYSYRVGLSMELGVRYHRSEKTAFGIAVADHQYLFPYERIENRFDVRVFMSTVF